MLYLLLKPLVFIAFHVYFRRISIVGRERIPKGRPVILAGNHPSAFLDALLPTTHIRPILYFMVRGDIYVNRLVRTILFWLHTMPIFRFRDGFKRMRGNQETFERAYRILARRKNPVLIMAEGGNSERKRLLPLQKGAAKLAFGAYEAKGLEDLVIVPFGVNYTNVWRFRSDAMLAFGEPLRLADYLERYRQDERRAVTELTRDLEREMRKIVVQIDREEDEEWVNPLLDIWREGEERTGALERELARVRHINSMSMEEKEQCREALRVYHRKISEAGLKKFYPEARANPAAGIWYLAAAPVFALAWLLNAPPVFFTHWLIKRLVPSPIFFPSIRFTAGLFIYVGYFLVGCWVVGLLGCWVIGVLGFGALPFFEGVGRWREARKALALPEETRQGLIGHREIMNRYDATTAA